MAGSPSSPAQPSPTMGLRWLGLSVLIVALDQWSKSLVLSSLQPGERVAVFDGFWDWTLAFNEGIAFSILSEGSTLQRYGLSFFALAVASGFAVWMTRLPRTERLQAIALALIIGGAVGNVVDRLRLGHVTDFILWYWKDHLWPAFNVADSSIFVGAVLLGAMSLFVPKPTTIAR